MGTMLSPAVYTKETDLSSSVGLPASSITAAVGQFHKGPCLERKLITNIRSLEETFGKPTNSNYVDWFTCWNVLQYNQLFYVVRAIADDALNAGIGIKSTSYDIDNATDIRINDDVDFDEDNITFIEGEDEENVILTLVDASGFTEGGDISTSGTGVGVITSIVGNVVTVAITSGDFEVDDSVDDSATYTTPITTISDVAYDTVQTEKIRVLAKYPGVYGNDLKISVCDYLNYTTETVVGSTVFADYFDRATIEEDEIAIIVHDIDPTDTSSYIVVESFICSTDPDAKNYNGESTWVGQYITRNSKYICAFTNQTTTFDVHTFTLTNLVGGVDGTLDVGDITDGYALFANSEEFDVNLIVDNHNTSILGTEENLAIVHQYIIDNVVETRKDCFAILTQPKTTVVNNKGSEVDDFITYKNTTLNRPTTYGAIYGNWKYQYDSYNDKYRWLPVSGDVAGIFAASDAAKEVWFAPAGLTRGQMKNVIKYAFNPDKATRDMMHKNNINIVTSFPGDGPVVYSQKTLTSKVSAFADIDVRRLFMYMEKAISTASRFFLFEKNTAFTRRQLYNMIYPFLTDIQGREGIDAFEVVIDESNNTQEVIGRNEMLCDIYVKPTRSIYYLQLNFINVKGTVSFSEIIPK